jgi:hypothetical protein
MSNHLTEDQFAKCILGQPTLEERKHLAECAECGPELDRCRGSISLFRSAVRSGVDARIASQPRSPIQPFVVTRDPKWRWALVAATALVLAIIPFAGTNRVSPPKAQAETDADALMRTVDLQLSRTIPAPMEPVIALLPLDEIQTTSGGVQ